MRKPRSCTATRLLALVASAFAALAANPACAGIAGTVVNLNGPLVAKKADGAVRVLTLKSTVEEGDVLATEKGTYARIRFVDNSEITMRPSSQLKIDSFVFEESKPEKDSATFSLVKGGLRAVTGALGKRNNERFGMSTPTATIGIRGTTFVVHYVPPPAGGGGYGAGPDAGGGARKTPSKELSPSQQAQMDGLLQSLSAGKADGNAASGVPQDATKKPADLATGRLPIDPAAGMKPVQPVSKQPQPGQPPLLPPGLHLQVVDGAIVVTNGGGGLGFSAGQFGYVPGPAQAPVIVPPNPNLQFTPPPSFSSSAAPQTGPGREGDDGVDCEVR
ncbi:MAG TPA: FecR domain-containing protein [Noviherbaspirillum sp.]|jgi:hypothetical protein|uniref:FecR family protein n=1 Tax=Noviherbaspirillum sp. TaxID=1926288 RepID=UPI002F9481A9